jgi:hypothetical protein
MPLTDERITEIALSVGMVISHDGQYMRSLGTHGGMNAEDGRAFSRAIEREVSAPPAAPPQPVAWRYREAMVLEHWQTVADWGDWRHCAHKPQGPASETFQIEPLFAAPAPAVQQQGAQEAPLGAIVNGRGFADRLEATGFNCGAGGLSMCVDWIEFRRCFDHLAEWAASGAK